MIDISTFKFGDIVYEVDEHNNAFLKKKIKTVIDGVEWFRYDRPHYEYTIKEIIYCGKVIHIITGQIDDDNRYETEYHFKYPDGNIFYEYECVIPQLNDWFATREQAEAYVAAESSRKNA